MTGDGREEIESIPWSELGREAVAGRRRVLYATAGAFAAVALGMILARAVWSAGPTTQTDPVVSSSVTSSMPPETTVPVLYEEADLVAGTAGDGRQAAITRAEWFVLDYFTADLEPNGTADVRSALPVGADLPQMPQDATVGLSYVEWAKAFRVEAVGSNRYRVSVVFRLLGAPPDEGFRRLAARAVSVLVEVNDAGGSVVVDLPAPAPVPPGPEPGGWPAYEEDQPPAGVIDGAVALVAGFGSEHRVLGASRIEAGWRVVVTAVDEVGNRWPLAVRVDERGLPLD